MFRLSILLSAVWCFVVVSRTSFDVDQEVLPSPVDPSPLYSVLIPNHYNLRYAQFGNQTAAEKVAAEYSNKGRTLPLRSAPSDYDPLSACSVTSQVRLVQKQPNWILESIDAQGNYKIIGGDEYFVTYRDNSLQAETGDNEEYTAAAFVQDAGDGTYALDFVTTPANPTPGTGSNSNTTGRGTVTVYFQYSCGIGQAHQPVKDTWTMGGATLIEHSVSNVMQPPMRPFQPPTGVDLSAFDNVIAFGDSLTQHMFVEKLCGFFATDPKMFFRSNAYYQQNPSSELNAATVEPFLRTLGLWHGNVLDNSTNTTALVIGSAVWDIIAKTTTSVGPGFTDHLNACRHFVCGIRARFPTATVIWKLPTAMHIHSVNETACLQKEECRRRLRYCSNSRVRYLRDQQLGIMKELHVPVLDVFEATYLSANQHFPSDVMHYSPAFNELLLDYFYNGDSLRVANRTCPPGYACSSQVISSKLQGKKGASGQACKIQASP